MLSRRVDPFKANHPFAAGRHQGAETAIGSLAGGFGPRRDKGQRGAVAGAMAPALEAVRVLSLLRAGKGNATLVSPARAGRFCADRQVWEHRQASARPGGREAPAGSGRALAGGFSPRLDKSQSGAVAGAMAPARMLKAHAGARVSRLSVRQPLRLAPLQNTVNAGKIRLGVRPGAGTAHPQPVEAQPGD